MISSIFKFIKKLFGKTEYTDNIKSKKYRYLSFIFKKSYGLSYGIEMNAVNKHNNLIKQFIQKNRRNPTRYELGKIVVHASHLTLKYKKGQSGHLVRQRIRHYLFNLHGISYVKI